MDVTDLIKMIHSLPEEDMARIRASLNEAAVGVENLDVLDIPLGENDANAATIRDYLKALLRKLWEEEEGFSGKRPFGNSGWAYDFDDALARAGKVSGTQDEDGRYEVDRNDRDAVNDLIFDAIDAL